MFRKLINRWKIKQRGTELNLDDTLYINYSDALMNTQGYEYQKLVNVISQKTKILRDTKSKLLKLTELEKQNLLFLHNMVAKVKSPKLSILDFGGQLGATYFKFKRMSDETFSHIKWIILETDALVEIGRSEFSDDNLSFENSILSLQDRDIDIIQISNSLQYSPDPILSLKELISLNATYLYMTHLPIHEGIDNITTIQYSKLKNNGPGQLDIEDEEISYPITFIARGKLEKIIEKSNYEIELIISENSKMYYFNREYIKSVGYLLKRKD